MKPIQYSKKVFSAVLPMFILIITIILSSCSDKASQKEEKVKLDVPTYDGGPARCHLPSRTSRNMKVATLLQWLAAEMPDILLYGADIATKGELFEKNKAIAKQYLRKKTNTSDFALLKKYKGLDRQVANEMSSPMSFGIEFLRLAISAAATKLRTELDVFRDNKNIFEAIRDGIDSNVANLSTFSIKDILEGLLHKFRIMKEVIVVSDNTKKVSKSYCLDCTEQNQSSIKGRIINKLDKSKFYNFPSNLRIYTKRKNFNRTPLDLFLPDRYARTKGKGTYHLQHFIIDSDDPIFYIQLDGEWYENKPGESSTKKSNSEIESIIRQNTGDNMLLSYGY